MAEPLVTVKTKRGFQRLEWQKLREGNEALDCRVYARAAAWIAGADCWMEAMWRDLEQQIRMAPEVATEMVSEAIEAVAGVIRRTPARRDRRVVSFKLHELTSVAETYEMQRLAIRAKC